MSARAEALATRLEQANQSVIDLIECDADLSVICPSEGWTAAALGAHVGGGHFGIVEYLVKPILAGQDFRSFDVKSLDEGNAKAAAENVTMPKDEILKLLREHGATAAAYVRGLSDEDLDRTTTLPSSGPEPVTAQQVIETVLIGHALDHGNSLRQGLGHAHHEHLRESVTA